MVASGQSLVLKYSFIVFMVLIFITTGCDCQDSEPCAAAIRKTEPWRDVTVLNAKAEKCDRESFQTNQWYSFQLDHQAAMIPITCVQSHRCGATIGMRINLEGQAMPQQGEYVNASLCGSYNVLGSYDCCVLRSTVTIFKCKNNDYVYRFHSPIDRCPAAICTQKIHEEVPKHAIALMGDPHPDQLNNTVSGNDEIASNEESEPEHPPEDIMMQEDESPVEIGNNTQQETGINGTQYPSSVTSEANLSQQTESNITGITQDGSSPTKMMPNGINNVSNNSNDTATGDIDSSVIAATTSPDAITTVPNQMTTLLASNTSISITVTEKSGSPTSTNTQDITSKDHRSPMTMTTNATAETAQITNKNTIPTVNTTSMTTKESPSEIVSFNATLPSNSTSLSPSASPSPPPLVTNSLSPSTTIPSTVSVSTPAPVSGSASTITVRRRTTTISTITTRASVTSTAITIPSSSSSSSSSSLQPTTLPSSTSTSSSSSLASTSEPSAVTSDPSASFMSQSMTQSQSPTLAPSSSPTPFLYTSISQSSRMTQSSSSGQVSPSVITTPLPQLPTHEVLMIESLRFVFLGAYWEDAFGQEVMMLLNYFLNTEMAMRRVDEPSLDPWFEITQRNTVVENRNETTRVDAAISHAWPDQLLYLFETTDFADYLYEEGNLTLLVACRPSKLCQLEDDYTLHTVAPPPHSSDKTPQRSPSSTFDKNLPVLIAVTTICAFCLIVMVTGVMCAKCRKKRRSWNAGNNIEKKSIKDNRPNCEGTPGPFTDVQIMSDEDAADGSANGIAVDGGETMQDNSWVVPLEDIELDDINREPVAEATEDTKF